MKEAFGQLQTCRVDYIWTYGQANEYVELIEGGLIGPFITNPIPGGFHHLTGLGLVSASLKVPLVRFQIRIILRIEKGKLKFRGSISVNM